MKAKFLVQFFILLFSFLSISINAQVKLNRTVGDFKKSQLSQPLKVSALFNRIEKTVNTEDGTKLTTVFYIDKQKLTTTNTIGKLSPGEPKKRETDVKTEKGSGWECQTSKIKVSLEDDSFMNTYNEQKNSFIYPGAVYTFDNFYDGSFKTETAARNPFYVHTSAPVDGDIFEFIDSANLNQLGIRNATNKLSNRIKTNNSNKGFKAKIYECNSSAEMALAIGAGFSGYGAKLNFNYGNKKSNYDRFFMIDATQEMYSLNADIPENGVFANAEDGKKSGLMFLNSITYGMRVLVSVRTTIRSEEDLMKFGASYSGFGFGANASLESLQKSFNEETEVKIYVVGGENTGFLEIDPKQLMNKLNQSFAKLSTTNAAPIYFSFRNMNNEMVRTESATDSFTSRQCIPTGPEEDLQYYDVSLAFNNIQETVAPNEKKSIGVKIDGFLYKNGERVKFDNQNRSSQTINVPRLGPQEIIKWESFLYNGKPEDPKEMIKEYGRPNNGEINFHTLMYTNGKSDRVFKTRMTKKEIQETQASVKVNIPILADYMGNDDWKFYNSLNKSYYLSEYLANGGTEFKIEAFHNDGKRYIFTFSLKVEPTGQYADPPKVLTPKHLELQKSSTIKTEIKPKTNLLNKIKK